MKSLSMRFAVIGGLLLVATALAAPASADPATDLFNWLQHASVADVQTAQAVYDRNPTVPTYAVANECLSWAYGVLTTKGNDAFNLEAPAGVVSTIADIDVGLTAADGGIPTIMLDFNANCGGYIEDLKLEAGAHANSVLFGLIKF